MKRYKISAITCLFLTAFMFGCAQQAPHQDGVDLNNVVDKDLVLSRDVDCLTELENIDVKERHKFNRIYKSCENKKKAAFKSRYIENSYYIGEVYE